MFCRWRSIIVFMIKEFTYQYICAFKIKLSKKFNTKKIISSVNFNNFKILKNSIVSRYVNFEIYFFFKKIKIEELLYKIIHT